VLLLVESYCCRSIYWHMPIQLRGAIFETAQSGKELGALVNTSEAPS
jgi:hypothetical protein